MSVILIAVTLGLLGTAVVTAANAPVPAKAPAGSRKND